MTSSVALAIAVVTYAGIAVGGIPGLALDRTGIAVLGAIGMIVSGELSLKDAVASIDVPTVLLLYGLMVLSAQFRLGGLYTWTARRLTSFLQRPGRFLIAVMATSAIFSSVLMNDIVCLAFTPVIAAAVLRAGFNPAPFLIGLAVASNIGSAATIIGNPQNMLIGQLGALHFGRFLLWCAPPSVLALAFAYLIIKKVYRGDFRVRTLPVAVPQQEGPPLDTHQSMKGGLAAAVLIGLFFTSVPRELSAICVAGVLLCSRSMHTRSILGLVDWHLITLFCGLFIIVKGLETTGVPAVTISYFESHGLMVGNPLVLTAISGTLSCLVSNVPATMFLTRFLNPANPVQWYVLALSSTFAGNLITIGSIANLITFEQAKVLGIEIGFREHARIGVPVTILSLIIAVAWISMATRIIPVQ